MSSSEYELVSQWTFQAPIDNVWKALACPEEWPQWWKGVRAVGILEHGGADGVGTYRRMTWRSALPYELSFNMRTTRVEPQRMIEGIADGELSGRGVWTLSAKGAQTTVRYDWTVQATKAWMRLMAPVAKPLFAWNHGVVMAWGQRGLSLKLAQDSMRDD